MRKAKGLPRICVGVDLTKQQFTVHAVNEETGEMVLADVYPTSKEGCRAFCKKQRTIEYKQTCSIKLLVDATAMPGL